MNTIFSLFTQGFVVLVLLPLAVLSLLKGSPPPQNSFLTKYHLAEPKLMMVGDVFLVSLAAIALVWLLERLGLIAADLATTLDGWLMIPFFALLILYLGLYARAILKVRRAAAGT